MSSTSERTRLRRAPHKEVLDRNVLHEILDASLIAHVTVSDADAQPYVLPVGYARAGERVLFHGSSGSRLFRNLAEGGATCFTVTRHDGMVLARSGFASSMLFRCVMVLGSCHALEGRQKLEALRLITEHLLPGRWAEIRPPSRKELAATLVLELPLAECSVKVATADRGLADEPGDIESPLYGKIWAGIVPITESFGEPRPDEAAQAIPVPDYLKAWQRS